MSPSSKRPPTAERVRSKRGPIVVAIAGGSGSGKTWLADRLQEALGAMVTRISLDNFYRDRSRVAPASRARINFDHPRAIDWPRIEEALRALVSGRSAAVPIYDFKTHSRLKRVAKLTARSVILVEGLWPLRRREIQRLVSLGIFLKCPAKVRLQRRIARDQASRGRTSSSVRKQFDDCVEPMHLKFVEPQAKAADLVLHHDCGKREVQRVVARIKELSPKE